MRRKRKKDLETSKTRRRAETANQRAGTDEWIRLRFEEESTMAIGHRDNESHLLITCSV
jgi:hypothetical protein